MLVFRSIYQPVEKETSYPLTHRHSLCSAAEQTQLLEFGIGCVILPIFRYLGADAAFEAIVEMCVPMQASVKSTRIRALADARTLKPTDKELRTKPQERTIVPDEKSSRVNCKNFPARTCAPASSVGDIRCRFLNRLGIQKGAPSHVRRSCAVQPNSNILKEPVKIEKSDDNSDATEFTSRTRSSSLSSASSSHRLTKSRSVSFDDSITVRTIPRREAYSDRIKQHLWSDRQEAYQNAQRNAIEFAAENWDWRQAVEDEEMVETGLGKIHPVHFARQCNTQRNFLLVMAARQAQHCN